MSPLFWTFCTTTSAAVPSAIDSRAIRPASAFTFSEWCFELAACDVSPEGVWTPASPGGPDGVLTVVGDRAENRHAPAGVRPEVVLTGAETHPGAFRDAVRAGRRGIDMRIAGFARLEADVPEHVLEARPLRRSR